MHATRRHWKTANVRALTDESRSWLRYERDTTTVFRDQLVWRRR